MQRPAAIPTVQIDVVPQTTGALLLETPDGPVTSQLTAGIAYARPEGRGTAQ